MQLICLFSLGNKFFLVGYASKAPYSVNVKDIESSIKDGTVISSASPGLSSEQPSNSSRFQQEDEERAYEENIRVKILQASLQFVHNHGWSKEALSAGNILFIINITKKLF